MKITGMKERGGKVWAPRRGGSPVGELGFWRAAARGAIEVGGTPCFVFAADPLVEQVGRLEEAFAGLPVRHWWSFKTLPLRAVVEWWKRQGRPVEVVSEAELKAVLELGFEPGSILVNGPAKHAWLGGYAVEGLRVNFDSVAEIRVLGRVAKKRRWRVGARLSMATEENFEFPGVRAQFGLLAGEVSEAAVQMRKFGLEAEVVHFHLRTNVGEARYYRDAMACAMALAVGVGWSVSILDIGGGFPPGRICTRGGLPLDAGFSLASMRGVVAEALARYGLRELWMENGRWLTAPGAVLAIKVLDIKDDPARGARTLICDGGRTLQAMVATWEKHAITPLVDRRGRRVATLVHGPTCMAFDNLGLHDLPVGVKEGDVLLWWDAGAYQLSWETRFSHGLAAVAWVEGGRVTVVRHPGA